MSFFRHSSKSRPFRIVILGQNGVGKSALTVRFLTRRFIGDYDPLLENTYSCTKTIDDETVYMEIRDTSTEHAENNRLDANIKWADAYVLIYDITDRCSFNECSRFKVLINSYSKKAKNNSGQSRHTAQVPIALVGNKCDRTLDRMVSKSEGREKANELQCMVFHEISVREDFESASMIFFELYKRCKKPVAKSELLQRQSCPPSLFNPPSPLSHESDEINDIECSSPVPYQRRRMGLFTIS